MAMTEELRKKLVKGWTHPIGTTRKVWEVGVEITEEEFKADTFVHRWSANDLPIVVKVLVNTHVDGIPCIGAVELGHGYDLLFYKKWHVAKNGIFLPEVVFVSDYHGFPEGALYTRKGE